MKPKKLTMEIISHETVGPQVRRMVLAGETDAKPGQFVQVSVSDTYDPFLKRPISVHDAQAGMLTLLYRVWGRGTEYLSKKQTGDTLAVVGPLGNGFPVASRSAVVIAGGIGAAPLYYLLRDLKRRQIKSSFFYGARTESELVLRDAFRSLAGEYFEATDDGTAGYHGLVTDLARDENADSGADVYACGPTPMLRAAAGWAKSSGRLCYVSLEARMACGVGACLGCVIPGASGEYRRVCVDGPVFRAEEVFGDA